MRFVLPLIALALVAAPAAAAPAAQESVTVRIAFGDLDVTTPEGRAALEARINTRLRKACTIEGPARHAFGRPVIDDQCVADARAAALAEMERVIAARADRARTVAVNQIAAFPKENRRPPERSGGCLAGNPQ